MADWLQASLAPADREMLRFATKLTLTPYAMGRDDVQRLRRAGFTDRGVLDIVQVTGLFAYYNRVADGLGIDDEPEWSGPAGDAGSA